MNRIDGLAVIIKNAGSLIVYAGFAAGAFIFTKDVLYYLLVQIKIGSFLLHRFISVILFMFFIAVNLGNIIVSYSTMYKSAEVNYLLTKPLSYSKIFVIKFLDNFFYSSTTLLLIISAVFAGYAYYFNISPVIYLLIIFFIIIPFMLTAASLGAVVLMLLIKAAKKFGTKKTLLFLASVYALSLIIFFRFSNPVDLVSQVMVFYPDTNRYFGFLDNPIIRLFPNFWAADALYWISSGQILKSFPDIVEQILVSVIFFSSAVLLSIKWYRQTWKYSLEIFQSPGIKNKKRKGIFSFDMRYSRFPQAEVIVKKEFWTFTREPAQWIHFSIMLLLIIIFLSGLSGVDFNLFPAYDAKLRTVIYLVVFLFNAFLLSALALRFVFPGVSIEGETFWKIRSAPVKDTKLIRIKFLLYFTVMLLIGETLNYFSQSKFPAQLFIPSALNTAFICLALTSLNFGLGGLYSDFKEKSAIRIASSQGATITFLLSMAYLVFIVSVQFNPLYNFFKLEDGSTAGLLNPVMITAIVSVITAVTSMTAGLKSLRRDF